mmetsp:Transcript_14760/g.60231  ORF Transcript_14760/g.60231 Transcript_14760/m.60231 type:complete len:203 (+) Transcript_14760:2617-3225(+)
MRDALAGEVNRHARRWDVKRRKRMRSAGAFGGIRSKETPPSSSSHAVVAFALVVARVSVDAGVRGGVHARRRSLGEPLPRSLQRTVRYSQQLVVHVPRRRARPASPTGVSGSPPLLPSPHPLDDGVRAGAPAPRARERPPRRRLRARDRAAVLLAAAADANDSDVHQLAEPVVRHGSLEELVAAAPLVRDDRESPRRRGERE